MRRESFARRTEGRERHERGGGCEISFSPSHVGTRKGERKERKREGTRERLRRGREWEREEKKKERGEIPLAVTSRRK